MKKLLLLSDDQLLNKYIISESKKFPLQTNVMQEFSDALENIKESKYDAVIANIPLLSEQCPKRIISQVNQVNPYIPIFILMDKMDVSRAITFTKLGAENCYAKPFAFDQILENIHKCLTEMVVTETPKPATVSIEISSPKIAVKSKYVLAKSPAAQYLHRQIEKVADTNFTVIIYGETGTGKESVARRLCSGFYKNKPFIAVDCGCLNKELAASELFGHKKGSFSGAIEEKKGAFEEANGGTIFLDEIGNLDYSVQILLLRAIEEKKIKKIGSNEEIDINVRIIVASNEKLSIAVQNGTFREDLFYRLNEFEIVIPPLRERMEDLQVFIDFFIHQANEDLKKNIIGVSPDLLEKFESYTWPGNIRELKNVIRRGCLMAIDYITSKCMSTEFINEITKEIKGRGYIESIDVTRKDDLKFKSLVAEYEEIIKILKEENYNKTKAAIRLNINRKTLYNKLKSFENLYSNSK